MSARIRRAGRRQKRALVTNILTTATPEMIDGRHWYRGAIHDGGFATSMRLRAIELILRRAIYWLEQPVAAGAYAHSKLMSISIK